MQVISLHLITLISAIGLDDMGTPTHDVQPPIVNAPRQVPGKNRVLGSKSVVSLGHICSSAELHVSISIIKARHQTSSSTRVSGSVMSAENAVSRSTHIARWVTSSS